MEQHSTLPTVEGPIVGFRRGYPFASYYGNIRSIGYVEEEYFISGTATRYQPVCNLTDDGRWTLQTTNTSAYRTRILVHRPTDEKKFNGITVLEWINVSFGYEVSFGGDTPGLYEDGAVYILISAQPVGLYGLQVANPQGLRQWDPARYGGLFIPDDAISYDIYTQVACIVNSSLGQSRILGGFQPSVVVGVGGSQSGSRLLSCVNGVQPLVEAFGVLMPLLAASHVSSLDVDPPATKQGGSDTKTITKIRTDLSIPVRHLCACPSSNDNAEIEGYGQEREPRAAYARRTSRRVDDGRPCRGRGRLELHCAHPRAVSEWLFSI
ncbi:hypothetical protein CLAIMM_12097 [Cladophialophora immunda]|nr:hypothetical protein CLAIMM_12097 [Cladophialophora immunda]